MANIRDTIDYLSEINETMNGVTDLLKRIKEEANLSPLEVDLIEKTIDDMKQLTNMIREREKEGRSTSSLRQNLKSTIDILIDKLLCILLGT